MFTQSHLKWIQQTRHRIAFYLDDVETSIGRAINLGITGLILVSLVIFITLTYPISPELRAQLLTLDSIIVFIFACEYLIRLWVAEDKIKYIFSLFSLVDLIAILPFFLGFINISYLRLFRWFRILRLIRFMDFKISIFRIQTEDGIIFTRIIFTLLTIIFVFSGLIYQVEHPTNPEIFKTFLDAVYFSVVTMTTVGFGDVIPLSEMGRFLTILMILTGIALIPWQLGDLVKQLVKTANQIGTVCLGCGWSVHDTDARFCKRCGTPLPKKND